MKDEADLKSLINLKKKKRINSRTKGNTFERKIAASLNAHYKTEEFMRTPGSGAFATTHKLPEHLKIAGDLITPREFPWLIECKKGYKFTISDLYNVKSDFWEIINKLIKEADKNNKYPLLIFQQDRQTTLCMFLETKKINAILEPHWWKVIRYGNFLLMPFEDFLELIQPTLPPL